MGAWGSKERQHSRHSEHWPELEDGPLSLEQSKVVPSMSLPV